MPDEPGLTERVAAGMSESQNVEWKRRWRDEYLRWICGFANAEGGVLIIGRDDDGQVVGVPEVRKLLEDIPNKVRDVLGIVVDVNLRAEAGKEYLEVVVEPQAHPVSYKGEYHYRSGSTRQELKGAALSRFLLRKQGLHWDGVPVPHARLEDLSEAAVDRFREEARRSGRLDAALLAEPTPALVDRLHLRERSHLKRAALLLFHPDPEVFFTGAYVKIGFFRDNVDLLYHDEIHGDLFAQVARTIDLLSTKYLRAGIRYEGIRRVESFPIPGNALREAVLNAVVHKDYASGATVQISVYDDKLMIWNPGQLRRIGRPKTCWRSTSRSHSTPTWRMRSSARAWSRRGDAASTSSSPTAVRRGFPSPSCVSSGEASGRSSVFRRTILSPPERRESTENRRTWLNRQRSRPRNPRDARR